MGASGELRRAPSRPAGALDVVDARRAPAGRPARAGRGDRAPGGRSSERVQDGELTATVGGGRGLGPVPVAAHHLSGGPGTHPAREMAPSDLPRGPGCGSLSWWRFGGWGPAWWPPVWSCSRRRSGWPRWLVDRPRPRFVPRGVGRGRPTGAPTHAGPGPGGQRAGVRGPGRGDRVRRAAPGQRHARGSVGPPPRRDQPARGGGGPGGLVPGPGRDRALRGRPQPGPGA